MRATHARRALAVLPSIAPAQPAAPSIISPGRKAFFHGRPWALLASLSAMTLLTLALAASANAQTLIGSQSLAPSTDSNNAGVAQAFQYTAAASGTTTDIRFYVASGTTATAVQLGLYNDAGGKPGTLLGQGTLSTPQANAWNDVGIPSVTVTKGQAYWIAVLPTNGQVDYLDTGGGSGASYVDSSSSLSSLSQTYASGNEYNVSPLSAYVVGTTAGSQSLLGDENVATANDSNSTGVAQAFQYQATTSGTATDIEVYVASGTTATTIRAGLYSDVSGEPASLLASGTLSSPETQAWNDVSISGATISEGQKYWIALLPTNGQLDYRDTAGGSAASYVDSNHSLTALPQAYAPGSEYNVSPMSAYVMGTGSTPADPPPSGGPAFVCPSGARCFYVDYASGSDANSGTSEASPWQHAPGMQGCSSGCASTTPQADDYYILKGGVTWPNAVLPWVFHWSGSASHGIYIGVDPSWFAGSSWSRPILNGDGKTIGGVSSNYSQVNEFLDLSEGGEYVTVDDLEFTGAYWSNTSQGGNIFLNANNSLYDTVEQNYFHGWSNSCSGSAGCDPGIAISMTYTDGTLPNLEAPLSPEW